MTLKTSHKGDKTAYIQSSFLDIDTTVIQLPTDSERASTFEHRISDATERIEVTHQQLSRGAAGLIMVGFLLFFLGYNGGAQQRSGRLPSEILPASLYTGILAEGGGAIVLSSSAYPSKEYGRFATYDEAATLCEDLHKRGLKVALYRKVSYTVAGEQHYWYTVSQVDEKVGKVQSND